MTKHTPRWTVALGTILLVLVPAAAADSGPWKIATAQSGIATTAIQAGRPFQVLGEGFHARVLPVKVCVDGRGCQLATLERDGSFMVEKTFLSAGVYEVEAWQARDMKITEWRLKASMQVAVHN